MESTFSSLHLGLYQQLWDILNDPMQTGVCLFHLHYVTSQCTKVHFLIKPPLNRWFKVLFSFLYCQKCHLLYYFMTLLSAERAIPRLCDKQEKEIVTEELWVLQGWSLSLGAWKLLNLTCVVCHFAGLKQDCSQELPQ